MGLISPLIYLDQITALVLLFLLLWSLQVLVFVLFGRMGSLAYSGWLVLDILPQAVSMGKYAYGIVFREIVQEYFVDMQVHFSLLLHL